MSHARRAPSNPEAKFQNHLLGKYGAEPSLLLLANVVKTVPNPWGPGHLTFGLGEGTPDIIGSVDGRAAGWELKVPGKKAKKHQAELHAAWRALGWFVASDITTDEDFEASLVRCRAGANS